MIATSSFQIFDLLDFNQFITRLGYISEATNGAYEVARYRLPDPSGDNPPVLVYRKKSGPMTVWPNGNEIPYLIEEPHRFENKSPRVTKIEAGEIVVSPASADDLPW